MTDHEPTYAFANAATVQHQRLRSIEASLDAGSIRVLEALGVNAGWRCLEVGAGGGSIAAWLCRRVHPGGSVLATDLDVALLDELSYPNLECRVHDVLKDDLPEDEFDLVHLRLVLAWLREPQAGLLRLVSALKPGGCLVAEEMDFQSLAPDPSMGGRTCSLFSRAVEAHHAVLSAHHAFDPFYGRRVSGSLAEAGLVDVQSEGRAAMWRGGEAGGMAWQLTFAQLRHPIIGSGIVTPGEIDEVIELCADPRLSFLSQLTMAAWGRRAIRPGTGAFQT